MTQFVVLAQFVSLTLYIDDEPFLEIFSKPSVKTAAQHCVIFETQHLDKKRPIVHVQIGCTDWTDLLLLLSYISN